MNFLNDNGKRADIIMGLIAVIILSMIFLLLFKF
jgi:hypothetical protein